MGRLGFLTELDGEARERLTACWRRRRIESGP
jgi:hypothetical protein